MPINSNNSAIVVNLNAVDNISSVIRNITSQGVLMGNLMTNAIMGVMGATQKVFGAVRNQFTVSVETQLGVISSAGALMGVLDTDYGTALELTKELNTEFTKMARVLPGVTREYAQIGMSVADDVINAFRSADGVLDLPKGKAALLELTRGFGILTKQTNSLVDEASQNVVRLMSGDIQALRMVMFDKAPAFKKYLKEVLAENNKTLEDWNDITAEQRVMWLNEALKRTIPPESVANMQQTVDAIFQGWVSDATDSISGYFGFLRELGSRGNKTIMNALEDVMMALDDLFKTIAAVNPFKIDLLVPLFDSLKWIERQIIRFSSALKQGFGMDNLTAMVSSFGQSTANWFGGAMSGLMNAYRNFVDIIGQINPSDLDKITVSVVSGLSKVWGKLTSGLLDGIVGTINSVVRVTSRLPLGISKGAAIMGNVIYDTVKGIFTAISRIDLKTLVLSVGRIGAIVMNSVTELINAIATKLSQGTILGRLSGSFDLGQRIGRAVGLSVAMLIKAVTDAIANLKFADIIRGISAVGQLFVGFVSGLMTGVLTSLTVASITLVGGIGKIIAKFVAGVIDVIAGMFRSAGSVIGGAIMGVMRRIKRFGDFLVGRVATGLTEARDGIGSMIGSMIDAVVKPFRSLIDSVVMAFRTVLDGIKSVLSGLVGAIRNGINTVVGAVKSVFSALTPAMPSMPLMPQLSMPKLTLPKLSLPKLTLPQISLPKLSSPAPKAAQPTDIESEMAAYRTAHNARGNLMPLMTAIRKESAMMPSGSNLTIANTSETILNRNQTQNLARLLTSNRYSSDIKTVNSRSLGNITININGANQSPEAIANAVIAKLTELT